MLLLSIFLATPQTTTNFPGITSTGLDCVSVLIGVYERNSGVPVIGIVAQPFGNKLDEHVYSSSLYWGICLPTVKTHNCNFTERDHDRGKIGIFSSSEDPKILQRFNALKYELAFSAGAGHKALKVISNDANVYLLSKGSTFRWDTCGPQAILRALGGDVLDYATSVAEQQAVPIKYLAPDANQMEADTDWKCNKNGLIAVRNLETIKELLTVLKEN